jgi:hypothetical protein
LVDLTCPAGRVLCHSHRTRGKAETRSFVWLGVRSRGLLPVPKHASE